MDEEEAHSLTHSPRGKKDLHWEGSVWAIGVGEHLYLGGRLRGHRIGRGQGRLQEKRPKQCASWWKSFLVVAPERVSAKGRGREGKEKKGLEERQ